MNILQTLLFAEFASLKRWIQHEMVSKLLVLIGFFIVFFLVSAGFYALSLGFFYYLSSFNVYGALTVQYIIHSGIIVLLLLGVASAFIATLTMLSPSHKPLRYLFSFPLTHPVLPIWFFVKSTLVGIPILFTVLTPVSLAYAQAFSVVISLNFIIRYLFLLCALAVLTTSIGSYIAYLVLNKLPHIKTWKLIVGSVVIFLVGIKVFSGFIFPPTLDSLYTAPVEQFYTIYNTLPLSNPAIPTYWLTQLIISSKMIYLLPVFLFVAVVLILILTAQSRQFVFLYQKIQALPQSAQAHKSPVLQLLFFSNFEKVRNPLVQKDILSIVRTPSEIGYGLFLMGLAITFFAFLSRGVNGRYTKGIFDDELLIFTFSWMLFFASVFFLRLAFPLMAREKNAIWYLFSLPIKRTHVLSAKIMAGLRLCIFFVLPIVFIWFALPTAYQHIWLLMGVSIGQIVFLAVLNVVLGSIFPVFEEGPHPEKVTTSTMGIVALFLSLATIALSGSTLYYIIKGGLDMRLGVFIIAAWSGMLLLSLYAFARDAVEHYQF